MDCVQEFKDSTISKTSSDLPTIGMIQVGLTLWSSGYIWKSVYVNENLLLWEKSVLMVTQFGKISNSRLATPPDDESEMISDIRFDESQMISENLGRILNEYLGIISWFF